MGLKGSGKTKKMLDAIHAAVDAAHGDVVCIEYGKKLTYDVTYKVRLVDSKEYGIKSPEMLKGFISGLHAGNFDISHIFIDGLYKLSGTKEPADTAAFLEWCEAFGNANKMEFTISISDDIAALPAEITKYL